VGNFKVTSASILGDATRLDTHKVTIALARRGPADLAGEALVAGSRAKAVYDAEEMYVARVTNAPIYSRRISRIADAVAQKSLPPETRVLLELERRRDSGQDEFLTMKLLEVLKPAP
jgi:hypothetical protein